jgi:hypothetical protein
MGFLNEIWREKKPTVLAGGSVARQISFKNPIQC